MSNVQHRPRNLSINEDAHVFEERDHQEQTSSRWKTSRSRFAPLMFCIFFFFRFSLTPIKDWSSASSDPKYVEKKTTRILTEINPLLNYTNAPENPASAQAHTATSQDLLVSTTSSSSASLSRATSTIGAQPDSANASSSYESSMDWAQPHFQALYRRQGNTSLPETCFEDCLLKAAVPF